MEMYVNTTLIKGICNNVPRCRSQHDVVTSNVDCNVSTSYCQSSSGDDVDCLRLTTLHYNGYLLSSITSRVILSVKSI